MTGVLLPFGDRIISDGLFSMPGISISCGPGLQRSLAAEYRSCVEHGLVRRSLGPAAAPDGKAQEKAVRASNAAFLSAYREQLKERRLSARTVVNAMELAKALPRAIAPRPFNRCRVEDIAGLLGFARMFGRPPAAREGLARFVKFLGATGRLPETHAGALLGAIF